ncbi:MAG: Asp-tRNA(Asn)/Glu-tRNA(Gln) amidotransferase GatCAB subunit A, partial [Deltaproteobacteria bacterium]|nr:Asp-tRNA(Asn)/Glu-tRNA(Gln) amidotransferase GatCAB subunit A [Deltaproteobacteria bacterium]
MVDEALSCMSLTEISEALVKREISSQEVVSNCLEVLEKRGSSLNCVARLFPEQA